MVAASHWLSARQPKAYKTAAEKDATLVARRQRAKEKRQLQAKQQAEANRRACDGFGYLSEAAKDLHQQDGRQHGAQVPGAERCEGQTLHRGPLIAAHRHFSAAGGRVGWHLRARFLPYFRLGAWAPFSAQGVVQ